MVSHIECNGTMCALPGSERMGGGPHICMYHVIEDIHLDDWTFNSVYMHVAYQPIGGPYVDTDCQTVLYAVYQLKVFPILAAGVLLRGDHFHEHPLPGVYTVYYMTHRVDMRAYKDNNGARHLWAEMYRSPIIN